MGVFLPLEGSRLKKIGEVVDHTPATPPLPTLSAFLTEEEALGKPHAQLRGAFPTL